MSEEFYAEPAKLYTSLRESDALDIRLKERNTFNNSIQNIKDIPFFIIMKLTNIKRNRRHNIKNV